MSVAGRSNSASQNLLFFPVSSRRTLIPTCQSILHRHRFGKALQWHEQHWLSLAFSSVRFCSGIEYSQELSAKGKGEGKVIMNAAPESKNLRPMGESYSDPMTKSR